jgi:hemerythrin superfamily protein
MTEDNGQDAVTLLQEQHGDIRELLRAVEMTNTGRHESFEPLVRLLAVHETAEEMVVYPSLRREGDVGDAVAEARVAEEDEAKKALAELEQLDLDSAEFREQFSTFRAAVEAHADQEEREVFPLLEQVNDRDELQRMARALKLAEGIAPTHAHKAAPTSALGNALVGPFLSMVDRARDAIRDATS